MSTETTTNQTAPAALPKIVISDVQRMLQEGQDREAIRVHYGLKKIDLKKLFMNPNLKGKKVHRDRITTRFEIVDDVTDPNAVAATPTPVAVQETSGNDDSALSEGTDTPATTEEDTY